MYEIDPARLKKAWPTLSRLARRGTAFAGEVGQLKALLKRDPPEDAKQLFSHYKADEPFWSFALVMLARAGIRTEPRKRTIKDASALAKLERVSFHHGDLHIHGDLSVHDGLMVTGNLTVGGVLTAYQQYRLLLVGGSVRARGFTSNCRVLIGDSLRVQEAIYVAEEQVTVARELRAKLVIESSISIGLQARSRGGILHDFKQEAMRSYPEPSHEELRDLLVDELFAQKDDDGAFIGPLFEHLSAGKSIWRPRPRSRARPQLPKALVAALRTPAKVKTLALEGLKLTSLPAELGALTRLKKLTLSRNLLRALPPELGQLTALEELWINDNRLEGLPNEIGELQKVIHVIASENRLTDLPATLPEMKALVNLNLADNPFDHVPRALYGCHGLTGLSLGGTKIRHLDADIGRLGKLNGLSLGGELKSLPNEFGRLGKLEHLYIFNGALRGLPSSFAGLKQLRNLSLIRQELAAFPEAILGLSRLETLYLVRNKIRSIPDELFDLPALKTVYLDGNPIPKKQQMLLAERARSKGKWVAFQ